MCTQGQSFIQDRNTQYNLSPGVTLMRGHHRYHFGAQYEAGYDNYAQTNVASGAFDFCASSQPCFSGFPFADFLLGYADNFSNFENHFFAQAVVPAFTAGKQAYRAIYFNDTWHAVDRLTINLGLRYEVQSPWSERFDRLSYFDSGVPSYINQYLPPGSSPVMGDVFLLPAGIRSSVPLSAKGFAPRIGVAYSLTSKTLVRGGYGIFWVPNDVSFALNPINDMVNTPGTTYTGTVDGTHPYNSISLPFPNGISPPPGRTLGTSGTQQFMTQVVQSITEVNRFHHPEGYVQQWNLNVERQLPAGFFVVRRLRGIKGNSSGAIFSANRPDFRCAAVASRAAVRRWRNGGSHLIEVCAQSVFCERTGASPRRSHYNRRATPSTLSAIHQRRTRGARIVRQHLSLSRRSPHNDALPARVPCSSPTPTPNLSAIPTP